MALSICPTFHTFKVESTDPVTKRLESDMTAKLRIQLPLPPPPLPPPSPKKAAVIAPLVEDPDKPIPAWKKQQMARQAALAQQAHGGAVASTAVHFQKSKKI